jgi:hypothetical protein
VNYIWVVTTCIGKTRVPNIELLILDVIVGGIRSSYTEVLVKQVAGLDCLFYQLSEKATYDRDLCKNRRVLDVVLHVVRGRASNQPAGFWVLFASRKLGVVRDVRGVGMPARNAA